MSSCVVAVKEWAMELVLHNGACQRKLSQLYEDWLTGPRGRQDRPPASTAQACVRHSAGAAHKQQQHVEQWLAAR